jgi:hypothetical protein
LSFRENLRRGRSHLLIVVVMLITAAVVVSIEDENLARETGKPVPENSMGRKAPTAR